MRTLIVGLLALAMTVSAVWADETASKMFLQFDGGIGIPVSTNESDFHNVGFGGELMLGYWVAPRLSLGMESGYKNQSGKSMDVSFSDMYGHLSPGVYTRGYPPFLLKDHNQGHPIHQTTDKTSPSPGPKDVPPGLRRRRGPPKAGEDHKPQAQCDRQPQADSELIFHASSFRSSWVSAWLEPALRLPLGKESAEGRGLPGG
jgi:hypothetical protein